MDDDLKPWDRQPGETSKAYHAFVTYRDLGGERSLEKAAKELGKTTGTIDRWASQWKWSSRTAAWDSIPGRAVAQAYEDMAARIADQHERVATKLMSRLEQHLDLLPEGKVPSQTWSIAHGAGRQGHQFATELSKPADTRKAEITDAIENLISKLAGEG